MSRSLRRPSQEPEGSFNHALSGTKFTIYHNRNGYWQRLERDETYSSYKVDYVIGSGSHAMGYLVRIGDHLFQSPICYYTRLKRFDMAPGYEENRAPDFIRAATEECVLCHSGRPRHIEGTVSEYQSPAFSRESISCDRCHGDPARHLKMPSPGTIVNPGKLSPAARNSVCEQCHLKGVVRVLNPGRKFVDFEPGERLEEVYTIYIAAVPPGSPRQALKVISHAEQLGLSLCASRSSGRLWCGTCHDPHGTSRQTAAYYRQRCLACHDGALPKAHPARSDSDCVSCHMAKRNAKDGGHTVFTDHRISRRSEAEQEQEIPQGGDLIAWRQPAAPAQQRNLGLAYVHAGIENGSSAQIVRGYEMLADAEKQFGRDPEVLAAMGQALLSLKRPLEAADRFEHALEFEPHSAVAQGDAGRAWFRAGRIDKAVAHLEKAVELDPLLLPVTEVLVQVYRQQGQQDKLEALGDRVREALGYSAPQESAPVGP